MEQFLVLNQNCVVILQVIDIFLVQEAEGKEPGTIIAVIENGYKLHDRVIRAAKVIVAQ